MVLTIPVNKYINKYLQPQVSRLTQVEKALNDAGSLLEAAATAQILDAMVDGIKDLIEAGVESVSFEKEEFSEFLRTIKETEDAYEELLQELGS